jgi:hypothetical protein
VKVLLVFLIGLNYAYSIDCLQKIKKYGSISENTEVMSTQKCKLISSNIDKIKSGEACFSILKGSIDADKNSVSYGIEIEIESDSNNGSRFSLIHSKHNATKVNESNKALSIKSPWASGSGDLLDLSQYQLKFNKKTDELEVKIKSKFWFFKKKTKSFKFQC